MSDPEHDHIKLSPSQLTTFVSCPRKWAFDKLDGVPRAENEAANAGSAIHKEIEDWFLYDKPVETPTSKAIIQHLPKKTEPGIEIEREFSFLWPGLRVPVMMRGKIDLVQTLPTGVTVFDHKTTSSKKYFKTPEELLYDAQTVIYGTAMRVMAAQRGERLENIRLQWTYGVRESPKTRPPHTHVVTLDQDLTTVTEGVQRWSETVAKIVEATAKQHEGKTHRALNVISNTETCFKFGPCPYKDLCPDFSGNQRQPKEAEPMDMSVLARLAALSKAPVPIPTNVVEEAPKQEPSTVTAPVYDPPKMGLMATLRASAAEVVVQPPDAQPDVSPQDPPQPAELAPKVTKAKAKAPGRPRSPATDAELSFDDERELILVTLKKALDRGDFKRVSRLAQVMIALDSEG